MNNIRKWRFRFVVIVLVVGGFLGWMALQQTSTAGAAQKTQTVNPGLQMLRASEKGPPEMEKLKDTKPAPTKAPAQSSRDELLQQVLKQPGGKDKIQKANPKGLKLGVGSDTTGWSLTSLSSLNPFKAGVAHAGTYMSLTPRYYSCGLPFNGRLYIVGELGGSYGWGSDYARLSNLNWYQIGTKITKPCVYLSMRAGTSGWYLINFETYNGAKATLWHWAYGAGHSTVQTWDLQSRTGHVDHPALLNLSTGYHRFYWVVESGNSSHVHLYRVTAEKI